MTNRPRNGAAFILAVVERAAIANDIKWKTLRFPSAKP
jgi:hypothetical protein